MTHILYARVVALIFLVVFIFHMLRMIYGWEVEIGSIRIPMGASWVGVLVSGFLSAYGFRLSSQK